MKAEIHPKYSDCVVKCSCGTEFTTRSTRQNIHVEICATCHPFYTGEKKLVDSTGRIEKFKKRYSKKQS